MYRMYEEAEKELIASIAKEKRFWKRLGKVIALNAMLRNSF